MQLQSNGLFVKCTLPDATFDGLPNELKFVFFGEQEDAQELTRTIVTITIFKLPSEQLFGLGKSTVLKGFPAV